MGDISLKRDEVIDDGGKHFRGDPNNDFWIAQQEVAQFSKRIPIFTSHLRAKFGEFYRLEARGATQYPPHIQAQTGMRFLRQLPHRWNNVTI